MAPRPPRHRELAAIVQRYAQRGDDEAAMSVFHPHRLATSLDKQRAMVQLLQRHLRVAIGQAHILEIGCGYGDNLLQLLLWGARPEHLVGNELLAQRCQRARSRLPPETRVLEGDACSLPLPAASFDVVVASTVFSSILDREFRRDLADHVWTLVRPGGGVLWYDMAMNNPANPDVLRVTRGDLRVLFPQAEVDIGRLTLAPPLARQLAPLGRLVYRLADAVPLLRSHLVAWLGKPL